MNKVKIEQYNLTAYRKGLKDAIQEIKKTEKNRFPEEIHCTCLPFTIIKIKELLNDKR